MPDAARLTTSREDAEVFACQRVKDRGEGTSRVYTFDEVPPAVEQIDAGWVLKAASIRPIKPGEVVDCSKLSPEFFQ
jgi:hypothetical protein